jgi:hypothetical protein
VVVLYPMQYLHIVDVNENDSILIYGN